MSEKPPRTKWSVPEVARWLWRVKVVNDRGLWLLYIVWWCGFLTGGLLVYLGVSLTDGWPK